jgi:hypothetical protein
MLLTIPPGILAASDTGIAPDAITTQTLHFWVRSDLGVSDTSGAVDSWADQSGNGNDLSSSGTARPTIQSAALNGHDAIRFDGSNDYLNSGNFTALDTGAVHGFCVLSSVSWGANDYIYTLHSGSARQIRHHTATPQIRISGTAANVNAVSPSLGTFNLIQTGFLASTSSFQVLNDGSKVTGASEGSHVNFDRVVLGASGALGNNGNVDIVELAVFGGEITDATELAGLLDYFNNRYDLW